jgi:two-component system, chemotaxis family, chemotaxis protein CheY
MPRILLVEDSSSTRAFVRAALSASREAFGPVEVVEAASGFDALRLLPRGRYDIVISDINMPDVNGLELVRFIRKSSVHAQVPIILMSTQSSDRDRNRGLSLGANAYLAKPFTPESLVREVTRQLTHNPDSHHG